MIIKIDEQKKRIFFYHQNSLVMFELDEVRIIHKPESFGRYYELRLEIDPEVLGEKMKELAEVEKIKHQNQ